MRRPSPIKNARAIMAGRKERDNGPDFFATPPWATRALVEVVFAHLDGGPGSFDSIWEPACGAGHMAEVLGDYSPWVTATDLYDYGYSMGRFDFFKWVPDDPPDWVITNPPYNRAFEFTLRALDVAQRGVALFVRSQWAVEGVERYERLWRDRPPTLMAFFSERVPLCKGKWDPDGSTATAYCWLVWVKGREPMAPFWIPPGQRKSLTKPDDRARFAAWSMAEGSEAAE